MQKILVLLRARTGHDFSVYKTNTIRRRIERRINVHQLQGPQQYLRLLQENPHELDLLFKELLIGVTNFFRDAEAFDVLAKTVMPKLLASHPDDTPVRVWAAGCSSGEEAYSLAMTLQEGMDKLKKHFPVQIFGTDLDGEAIDVARLGLYPEGIARDVRPQRLARFFIKEDGGYRIKKEIREMVDLRAAECFERPAVHQAGSRRLPQPADLCETCRAGTAALALPLCAEAGRNSFSRIVGEPHRSGRPLYRYEQEMENLRAQRCRHRPRLAVGIHHGGPPSPSASPPAAARSGGAHPQATALDDDRKNSARRVTRRPASSSMIAAIFYTSTGGRAIIWSRPPASRA